MSLYWNTYLDFYQIPVWLGRLENEVSYIIVIYIGMLIVILIILDIFYVQWSFSRKKFPYVWPLQALRSSVGLCVTVLFLPFLGKLICHLLILESFTTILTCVQGPDGVYYHGLFPTLICYQGAHIIHVIFCLIVSVIFIVICITVSLTFYDNTITSNAADAKVH